MIANDVFISYKAEEFEEANWVRSVLEDHGISCWMAPMSIPGGSSYAVEIPQAIRACKVFVLILSEKAQDSTWVPKEIDQAINTGKTVLPFMLENCRLKDDFNFYLTNVQRYAAYESKTAAIEKMLREIQAILAVNNVMERKGAETSSQNAPAEAGSVSVKEKKAEPVKPIKKVVSDTTDKSNKPNKEKGKKKKGHGVIIALAAVVAIVVLVSVISAIANKASTFILGGKEYKKSNRSVSIKEVTLTENDLANLSLFEELSIVEFVDCTLPGVDLSEYNGLTDTVILRLDNCGITDEMLSQIDFSNGNVREVYLDNNKEITDLSHIAETAEHITKLSAAGTGINGLTFVKKLLSLQYLDVRNTDVTDISPVTSLQHVSELYLSNTKVSSLAGLSHCSELRLLWVADTGITSLEGIEGCIYLEKIDASNCGLKNIDSLANATKLTEVMLEGNKLRTLAPLKGSMGSLSLLNIGSNSVSDLEKLSDAKILCELTIDGNQTKDLSFLKNCTLLTYLSAQKCGLTSLSGIEGCTKLKKLCVSHNELTSLKGYSVEAEYTDVNLDASYNKLVSLDLSVPLPAGFSTLNLWNNGIEDVSVLKDTRAARLYLTYSDKADYSIFKGLKYYDVYIVDAPLNKQVELQEIFGPHVVKFPTNDEFAIIFEAE